MRSVNIFVVLILKCLIGYTSAEPVGTCPEENGSYVDFLTDSEDCSLFYVCNWGTPILYECPSILVFNPELNVCDWPENVDCSGSSSNDGQSEETDEEDANNGSVPDEDADDNEDTGDDSDDEESSAVECPAVDGEYATLLPDATDCGKYYACSNGIPIEMACPSGLEFNPTLSVCDWPESAGCTAGSESDGDNDDNDVSDENNTDDSDNTEEEEAEEEDGSNETDDTDDDSADDSNDEGSSSVECPAVDGESATLLPDESDCAKYYACSNGVPIEMSCPAGLEFNPTLSVCDRPESAGCTAGSESDSDNDDNEDANDESNIDDSDDTEDEAEEEDGSNETEDTDDDSADDSNDEGSSSVECPAVDGEYATLLPDESDCAKYYACSSGVPIEMSCPSGLEFNPTLSVCDWPETAGCTAGSEIDSDNDDNEDTSDESNTDDSDDTEDEAEEQAEEEDRNNETDDTNDDSADDSNDEGSSSAECPAVDGEYATLLPDESDCAKYYACSNGVPIEMSCPSGLEFNPTLSVCDWPESAGCTAGSEIDGDDDDEVNTSDEDNTDDSNNTAEEDEEEEVEGSEEEDNGASDETNDTDDDSEETSSVECPAVDGEYATLLPNESDCGKYYACSNGVPIEMSCPDGLEFNPTLSVCDWPESAGCTAGNSDNNGDDDSDDDDVEGSGDENDADEDDDEDEDDEDVEGSGSDESLEAAGACESVSCPAENEEFATLIPSPTDCTKFCYCNWGLSYEYDCPAGLNFNPTLLVCDWPSDAGCEVES